MPQIKKTYTIADDALQHIFAERPRYIALAVRYIGDRDEAEDIFQNCALDIMKTLQGDKEIGNLDAYFACAIKNRCRRHILQRNSETQMKTLREQELEYLSHLDNYEADKRMDCATLLDKCRERLPELTFEVYADKKFNGLDYETIGRKFNITERRVNTEIQKASKVFREEFSCYSLKYLTLLALLFLHI